ncbi:hypothetical protein BQ8482_300010 [Mesorhizobium delmotii]|uniref:Transposase n=1 Tax=Mesorhizobium delmotii TaxID=1631247 RepID=A0A2P9ANB0_9HYPH|nr:hypothetical protein BQ8482_300010 [Mesorhizobium delmotii]
MLGASNLTFAFCQLQPEDWIDGQVRALSFFGGITKAIVCDNLKAGVAKALWFEPTLNATFAAMAEHYDTTILPTEAASHATRQLFHSESCSVDGTVIEARRAATAFRPGRPLMISRL